MKHANTMIGLFQGMFEHNIPSFNPGCNSSTENVDLFDEIRELQAQLEHKRIDLDVQKGPLDSSDWGQFIFMISIKTHNGGTAQVILTNLTFKTGGAGLFQITREVTVYVRHSQSTGVGLLTLFI